MPMITITAPITATTITTTIDPSQLLRLMWLASPALPVGGFSYSEGLEAAVEAGRVRGEAQAGDWLLAQMELTLARAEGPVLARACAAWQAHDAARIVELNDWLRRTRETAELRAQAEQMGRALLEWLRHGTQAGDARVATLAALAPAPMWPVAYALATTLAGAAAPAALLAYAWSWAENMGQAAIKTVPLGQAAAQRLLGRLAAAIPALAERALALGDDERQSHAPMLAILSAQHETQYSRLFRS
ncbi:MAG: urease accessory protein UreF [Burkholderiales bacterium]|nr:urease accessory protein UreF [Burkholderiales bacterium]MDE1926695.1 urease accessory protein UreF [Burkholderiales bacterium]MDE2157548.1 urease accessory protein UreF [Burkholderiales bacterium]